MARKIRSKAYKDPYILPRPADISTTVRATNSVEFCHPGEYGYLVVHVVKEVELNSVRFHFNFNLYIILMLLFYYILLLLKDLFECGLISFCFTSLWTQL